MIFSADIPWTIRLRHALIRWLAKSDPIIVNQHLAFVREGNISHCYLLDCPIEVGEGGQVISNLIRVTKKGRSAISVLPATPRSIMTSPTHDVTVEC
jgi:hypothetical protein